MDCSQLKYAVSCVSTKARECKKHGVTAIAKRKESSERERESYRTETARPEIGLQRL